MFFEGIISPEAKIGYPLLSVVGFHVRNKELVALAADARSRLGDHHWTSAAAARLGFRRALEISWFHGFTMKNGGVIEDSLVYIG